MDKVFSEGDLVIFLRKASAVLVKKDSAGNDIYRAGSGKFLRVVRKKGSVSVQSIPGCGGCSKEGEGAP